PLGRMSIASPRCAMRFQISVCTVFEGVALRAFDVRCLSHFGALGNRVESGHDLSVFFLCKVASGRERNFFDATESKHARLAVKLIAQHPRFALPLAHLQIESVAVAVETSLAGVAYGLGCQLSNSLHVLFPVRSARCLRLYLQPVLGMYRKASETSRQEKCKK